MSYDRIEGHNLCEHGYNTDHGFTPNVPGGVSWCLGGSVVRLVPVEPDYRAHVRQNLALNVSDEDAQLIVDAALAGGLLVRPEGTP